MNSFVTDVVSAIVSVCDTKSVSLHEPSLGELEKQNLLECIDTNFVSSIGSFVSEFENKISDFTGARFVIAVNSGTAALHAALIGAGVNKNEEVLLPAFTFVATANAVSYIGAVPHFVDIEDKSLGIDPEKLRLWLSENTKVDLDGCWNINTGRKIAALLPVHIYGNPCRVTDLEKLAKSFKLILVEDAAESLGSYYGQKHTGTFGVVGTLSFNGNKILTTGGGGAVLTDNEAIARKVRHITTTAKIPHAWEFEHDMIGFNYRMPNINAAIGCAQMERVREILCLKERLHINYKNAFSKFKKVRVLKPSRNCQSNFWLQTIILHPELAHLRNEIIKKTNEMGIQTRPAWKLITKFEPYAQHPRHDLRTSTDLQSRVINLPSSPALIDCNLSD